MVQVKRTFEGQSEFSLLEALTQFGYSREGRRRYIDRAERDEWLSSDFLIFFYSSNWRREALLF